MALTSAVIGSNGYLGRHLACRLDAEGFDNSNFDIHRDPPAGIENYKRFDLTQKASFQHLNRDVDYIFLFAGLTGTDDGFDRYREFVDVNELGLLNLLEWMRETQSKARIVFPSTRLVYRGSDRALKEDDPCEAKTIYAANKLNAERLLWMYQNAFGIDYTVFRICVPYGNVLNGARSYGTLGFFLSQAESGKDITLFGDGKIRRTFTHASDISAVITKAVKSEKTVNDVFNIGGEDLSLLDAAGLVAKKNGVSVKLVEWPKMAQKLESGNTVFCDEKLQAQVPCDYEYTLSAWLSGLQGIS